MSVPEKSSILKALEYLNSFPGQKYTWAVDLQKKQDEIDRNKAAVKAYVDGCASFPIPDLTDEIKKGYGVTYADVAQSLISHSKFQNLHELTRNFPKQLPPHLFTRLVEALGYTGLKFFADHLSEPLSTPAKSQILATVAEKIKTVDHAPYFRMACETLGVADNQIPSSYFLATLLTKPAPLAELVLPYALKYTARDDEFCARFMSAAIDAANLDLLKYGVETLKLDPHVRLVSAAMGAGSEPVPAICYAIKAGPKDRVKLVEYLCEKGCADDYLPGEDSPLIYAINAGNFPCIKTIGDKTTDLEYTSASGSCALTAALRRDDKQSKPLHYILSKGVDVNRRRGSSMAVPLAHTLSNGRLKHNMFNLLISYGAEPDQPLEYKDAQPSRHILDSLGYDDLVLVMELLKARLDNKLKRPLAPALVPMESDIELA